MEQRPRDRLIDTALRLFIMDGFHATGIDRILSEAGVAKMTLYRHFRSKDELILATLERYQEQQQLWLDTLLESRQTTTDKLLSIFDAYDSWFGGQETGVGSFRGCLLINAVAEYGAPDDPIRQAASTHMRSLERTLERLIRDAGLPDSRALSEQLFLLLFGAVVACQLHGDLGAAARARAIAASLIGSQQMAEDA